MGNEKVPRRKFLKYAVAGAAVVAAGATGAYYYTRSPGPTKPTTPTTTVAAGTAGLIEGAQKEKELSVYAGIELAEVEDCLKMFVTKYPFMSYSPPPRLNSWGMAEKIEAESKAGLKAWDAVMITQDAAEYLVGRGFAAKYDSPENKNFDSKWIDKNGYYTVYYSYLLGMAASTKLPENLMPKDWADFADPKPEWKGKVSVADPRSVAAGYIPLYALYEKYGKDKLRAILEGLSKCDLKLAPSNSKVMEQLNTAEFPIAFIMMDNYFRDYAAQKAPVKWIWPTSSTFTLPTTYLIAKDAKNPNAAKLFADTLLSKDVADYFSKRHLSTRMGAVPSPDFPTPAQVSIYVHDTINAEQKRPEIMDMWKDILKLA